MSGPRAEPGGQGPGQEAVGTRPGEPGGALRGVASGRGRDSQDWAFTRGAWPRGRGGAGESRLRGSGWIWRPQFWGAGGGVELPVQTEGWRRAFSRNGSPVPGARTEEESGGWLGGRVVPTTRNQAPHSAEMALSQGKVAEDRVGDASVPAFCPPSPTPNPIVTESWHLPAASPGPCITPPLPSRRGQCCWRRQARRGGCSVPGSGPSAMR